MSQDQLRIIFDVHEVLSRIEELKQSGDSITCKNYEVEEFPASTWSDVRAWSRSVESVLRILPGNDRFLAIYQECPERNGMLDFYEAIQDRQERLEQIARLLSEEYQVDSQNGI